MKCQLSPAPNLCYDEQWKNVSLLVVDRDIIKELTRRWGGDGWYIYSAPFELYNRSLENTYICFLMWPPQHRHGNSNPVRFDRCECHCVIYFWLHKRWLNPRFPLHAAILDEDSIPNIQIFWSSLRFRCQGILCIIFGVRGFVLTSHDL